MPINKDIILRVLFSIAFISITFRVLVPIFVDYLKKKLPGHYDQSKDLDYLIKRQKERLRSQYGLSGDIQSSSTLINSEKRLINNPPPNSTSEVSSLSKELKWGGSQLVLELQSEIAKNFSYKLAESKVNAFVHLVQRRDYLEYLSNEQKVSKSGIKNFLVTLLIWFILVEETREKKFYMLAKIAHKLEVTPEEFALAIQLKLLMSIATKKELKEERIFSEVLVLNQYSDDTIKEASEIIAKKEANLWCKSPSQLFEELNLSLNFASMLSPLPKIKNRKDIESACKVLGVSLEQSIDEVKKTYKKMALKKHPDKIVSQKLPKYLERKAIDKFNIIQEALSIFLEHKK